MSRLRGSSLRAQLSRALVGLGLVSVVLLAAVNFFVVRQLLSRSAEGQLVTLREVRTDQIETAFEGLLERVSAIGADPAVGEALQAIDEGYQALGDQIPPADLERLEPAYAETTAPYIDAGAEVPPFDELLPKSTAGRYVQYHYTAQQDEDRRAVVDAGDGSAHSEAHARFHPFLVDLSESFSGVDILLVSARSNEIVYSVDKRIDLGTDVETGPHAETSVGAVWERLGATGAGDSVLADSFFYLPAAGTPTAHVGTVVRSGSEVIGAVVVELPIEVLTGFVSSGSS